VNLIAVPADAAQAVLRQSDFVAKVPIVDRVF
jgi:hypothetical protein